MIHIQLNGEKASVEALSVKTLLAELGLAGRPVAVEVNQQLVPARLHAEAVLKEGDQVELVTLVGGG